MISGFIWNSRGTGDVAKKSYIYNTIQENKFDFVGIQGTMRSDYPHDFLTKINGGEDFHWGGIPVDGRSGGILVGVNKKNF